MTGGELVIDCWGNLHVEQNQTKSDECSRHIFEHCPPWVPSIDSNNKTWR